MAFGNKDGSISIGWGNSVKEEGGVQPSTSFTDSDFLDDVTVTRDDLQRRMQENPPTTPGGWTNPDD